MREYLVVFLVAASVTYLLTVVAREIALRTGAVAAVRDRDVHAEPIPYLGGLAMLGGLVAAYLVARELPFLSSNGGPFTFPDARAVVVAGALICGVGVLDDIFDLDALTKFGGQVLAVGLLVYSGVQFNFFFSPNGNEQFSLDSEPGRHPDGGDRRGDRQRRELRRRPRRAGRRRRRHRRPGLLPLLLPAQRRQRGHPGHHRRAAVGRAGRGVRGLPGAQLPPGAALHGRQRLDADRPGALGHRDHRHHASSAPRTSRSAATAPGPASCRCCCRWRCRS